MTALPSCPKCKCEHTYEDGALLVCPECAHEWSAAAAAASAADDDGPRVVKDANGNVLGSSSVVKVGTKVRNIRLVDGAAGHDIDCRIDGIGPMQLKSEFVRKA